MPYFDWGLGHLLTHIDPPGNLMVPLSSRLREKCRKCAFPPPKGQKMKKMRKKCGKCGAHPTAGRWAHKFSVCSTRENEDDLGKHRPRLEGLYTLRQLAPATLASTAWGPTLGGGGGQLLLGVGMGPTLIR